MEERRDAAVDRRESLRRTRAAELLDGVLSPKLDGELAVVEREVGALEDAIGEQTCRDRDLRQQTEDASLAHARTSLAAAETKRLDAVQRAEVSARSLADAFREALEATGEIGVALNRLDVRPRPDELSLGETERRLSARLAAALTAIRNAPRFGSLPLRSRPGVNVDDNWLEAETLIGVRGLASILNKEEPTQ